ncbi:MAG: threonine dehydratase [Gammaproteobacteria bacterium]|nr:threonine dehydratase [Gammaproteobacteria bacterium]
MSAPRFSIPLARFEAAQEMIYRTIDPTPQIVWPLIAERCGTEVWVKHENHLPTGAFKVRGGLVYAQHLKRNLADSDGVIAATRGNHGQSVAFAARQHGLSALIVVPEGNSRDKNRAMQAYGAELHEYGRDFDEALAHAKRLSEDRGLVLFPSFDPLLIEGVGTYGIEFFRAVPDLDTVYVPIGLGSGICGLIAARDALGLTTHIVGVVAKEADAYARSFAERRVRTTASAETMADGLAVRVPNATALEIILAGADRIVTVSEEEIMGAIAAYFSDTHNVAEGAGAAALAALLKESHRFGGERVGVVLSGGKIDGERFARILTAQG